MIRSAVRRRVPDAVKDVAGRLRQGSSIAQLIPAHLPFVDIEQESKRVRQMPVTAVPLFALGTGTVGQRWRGRYLLHLR